MSSTAALEQRMNEVRTATFASPFIEVTPLVRSSVGQASWRLLACPLDSQNGIPAKPTAESAVRTIDRGDPGASRAPPPLSREVDARRVTFVLSLGFPATF